MALEKWKNEERPVIAHYVYRPPATTPFDKETGYSKPNFTYGYVSECAEVEVDVDTGSIKVIRLTCVDDVGKAINRQQVEGQIEGCVVQAAGYAVLENFIQQNGQVLTKTLSTYLIPTVLDIPDQVDSIILESLDPIGPWGARGMGEMPFLPLTPAITAEQAIGDLPPICARDLLKSGELKRGARKPDNAAPCERSTRIC